MERTEKYLDINEDSGVFTSWKDRPRVLPERPELAEDQVRIAERNSNRLRILEWTAGGVALFTTGLLVKRRSLKHA
jgi:hypothetical protein